ncbi:MAG: lipid IV(A) 3-deoxy-D-manno-octulosonic acid transferase [Sulfuricurvum sp.]|uniref:lipid IV(A) 3-deoxy-D-manno-octulosonic acid transferase n=1 Tax=Sulfuricurvum sp. TaxID=2025608 RepID=UPI0026081A38|nr:lipid IV(A) 3-deoxy-D-manno-octulosonic acid transferase [Sulfuricurvum sp.]MDD2368403.1 lipid IV(A) 3-deoxy-D-manno-octulosonic acid transferase [Sulfuricurvum sp.]MDD2949807.1 lipid IV(A) 3-deoxy-D-manno-octulosonic acid transferase [Sulfuricurvum sp.]MDD5119007.1 lipid IV(A) 3-deoxy-D-manno-octulosonic acid transferase [Sulfuricurvum sp.]
MRNVVFDLFYTFTAALLYAAAFPLLILFSLKKKYRESIPARFFGIKNPPFRDHDLWFHVCSLGEAKAISPLLEKLGDKRVAISVITHTGYEAASKYAAQVRYLPYEIWLWFWIERPKTVVVLEAEFWYLLFRLVRIRGGKVIALNARISDRSFPKYYRMRWFYRILLRQCDRIFCQSTEDMARFIALGATNVEVVGNIKLAQKIAASKAYAKPEGLLIVAASTHEGEEEGIIQGFIEYRKYNPSVKLLVVPRHPERFAKVGELIERSAPALSLSRWSESQSMDTDIILVDAMGELNNLYAISDVAILGGAFSPIGGHNPLEPAHFGCKIITGEQIFLQRELFKYVSHVQFVGLERITEALMDAQEIPPSQVNGSVDLQRILDYLTEK